MKIGPQAADNASKREKWLAASYRKMDRGKNIYARITDALVADGEATWKVYCKIHRWHVERGEYAAEEYLNKVAETRRTHFPFAWEHVASTTYYPLAWDEEGLSEVLEITEREAFPLLHQYHLGRTGGRIYRLEDVGEVIHSDLCGEVLVRV